MLRGFALAILLVNLALLFWGSSRAGPDTPSGSSQRSASTDELPTLVLLDDASRDSDESIPGASACIRFGAMPEDVIDTLTVAIGEAWNSSWRRIEEPGGVYVEVSTAGLATGSERDLRALAGSLGAQILPCRHAETIAPEVSRP